MAITIKGIKINDVHLEPTDNGGFRIKSAEYSLISSTDKILAKQSLGGYQGMALGPGSETKAALDEFMKAYLKDVQTLLGLSE